MADAREVVSPRPYQQAGENQNRAGHRRQPDSDNADGFFLGLPGVIAGPFLGAIAGELTVHRDWKRVGKAGLAAWIGFVICTAFKVALAFLMIGIFAAAFVI